MTTTTYTVTVRNPKGKIEQEQTFRSARSAQRVLRYLTATAAAHGPGWTAELARP
jgi:hypothetical protein